MTRRRTHDGFRYQCNREGCKAQFVTHDGNGAEFFTRSWEAAKAAGWRTLKVGAVWQHFCNWLHITEPS